MSKNLIIVKQLPQIEEHLKELSTEIDKKVESAKSLVCTEENVKAIKQVRADLNKEFKEVEAQRKAVKEQILAPYMQFEEVYKTYISEKYKSADIDLKQKIDSTENELKKQKEQEIKDYFEEYKTANNIDFVTYEHKQNLNVSRAIQEVANRHKLLEEEKKKQEEKVVTIVSNENHEITKESHEQLEQVFNKPLERPEEQKQEPILTLKFTVKGTRTKLKELKKFLEDGGYDYE